jgi:hypothetical protein
MPTTFLLCNRNTGNTNQTLRSLTAALVFILSMLIIPQSTHAAGFTVTNTNDSGAGSLRQAILDANASPGHDTIGFTIPGSGVHTIGLLSVLPTITAPVTIDGYTQPAAQANTLAQGGNANLLIELSGRGSDGIGMLFGLKITAGNSTVRGLVINRFGENSASSGQFYPGIVLETNGGNVIEGNYIGTDPSGVVNLGNGGDGVRLYNTSNNTIGGMLPAARNVISGNENAGVWISGTAATTNTVQGNYIGTNASGTAVIGNLHGVILADGSNNSIGGPSAGAGNIISGNHSMGVAIYGPGVTKNSVQGNFIGTDVSGTIDLGNFNYGIEINSAVDNTIGGMTPGAGNLISGNDHDGIHVGYIGQGDTREIVIEGNFIGTDVTGNNDLGNTWSGIYIAGANNTIIGGTIAGAGNLISGNDLHGIFINHEGTKDNVVQGNIIGANSTGSAKIGNTADGVRVENAHDNTVGGATVAAGNIIAYNGGNGVNVVDTRYTAVGNRISSNSIFSNTLLGIEVGVGYQATPRLWFAYNLHGATDVQGGVVGQAGTTLTLQFFSNDACDESGYGEGEQMLGTTIVTADSDGKAHIAFTPTSLIALNRYITVLATDTSNNTSNFSNCVKVITPLQGFIPLVQR